MIKEYKTIQEISGPLMVVKKVQGATYDELCEIELPDGSKVAQSHGWVNELSANWDEIIEHNDSGATPVKHPGMPRLTFAKSKNERGEDAYRFIGVFKWNETKPNGDHIYKSIENDMQLE